jgi:hypothetical protein
MAQSIEIANITKSSKRITLRSVLLGLTTIIALQVYTNHTGLVMGSSALVKSQYPMAMLIPFILWLFVNIALKAYFPRAALTSTELLVIYSMSWISSGIALEGWAAYWATIVSAPTYYASPENQWQDVLFSALPWWAFADTHPGVIRPFFDGLAPGMTIPWIGWINPIFWWGSVSFALVLAGICICLLFQRQWEDAERLTYPLGQFALHLTSGFDGPDRVPALFKNKIFWAGFFTVFGVILYNIVGYFVHELPTINIYGGIGSKQLEIAKNYPPLSIRILPSVVGLTYFCDLDILFSFWFVRLLTILKLGVMNRTGFTIGLAGQQARPEQIVEIESHGAMVLLVLWSIWAAREHLRRVWHSVRNGNHIENDKTPYRIVSFAFFAATLYIIGWMHAVGMAYPIAILHTLLLYIAYFTVAKFTAATGFTHLFPPTTTPYGAKGGDLLTTFVGTTHLSREDSIGIGLVNACGFFGNARVPAWPALPHHFKLLGHLSKSLSRLTGLALLAFVVGMVASFLSIIYIAYHYGGQNLQLSPFSSSAGSVASYNDIRSNILRVDRTVFDPAKMGVWLLGSLEAALLIFLRSRLPWWPIHPLGLIFQDTRGVKFYSFSLFLTWATKSAILRIGGITLYRRAAPFFIGITVGYVAGIVVSSIVDLIWFADGGHWIHTW